MIKLIVAFPCNLLSDLVPDRKYEFSYDDLGNLVIWSIWATLTGSSVTSTMASSSYDWDATWK